MEQIETAKEAKAARGPKAFIRRELSRIHTPATATGQAALLVSGDAGQAQATPMCSVILTPESASAQALPAPATTCTAPGQPPCCPPCSRCCSAVTWAMKLVWFSTW